MIEGNEFYRRDRTKSKDRYAGIFLIEAAQSFSFLNVVLSWAWGALMIGPKVKALGLNIVSLTFLKITIIDVTFA